MLTAAEVAREQIATELRRLHAENERLRAAAALVRAQALEEAAAELDHDWPADTIEERTMRKQYAKLIRALKASPDAGEPKPLP